MPIGILGPMLGAIKSGGGAGNIGAQFQNTVSNMMSNAGNVVSSAGSQMAKLPAFTTPGMIGRAITGNMPSLPSGGVSMRPGAPLPKMPTAPKKATGTPMPTPSNPSAKSMQKIQPGKPAPKLS